VESAIEDHAKLLSKFCLAMTFDASQSHHYWLGFVLSQNMVGCELLDEKLLRDWLTNDGVTYLQNSIDTE
jgi:hypothetical protein